TGQYINIPHNNSLNSDSALTIEAWILPTTFSTNLWENVIVGKDGWGSGEQGYTLRCGAAGTLSFNFGTPGQWREVVAPNVLQTNVWQHVAATFDGDSLILYKNGVRLAATGYSGTISSSTYNLTIGRIPFTAGGTRDFRGELDEIRLYSEALSVNTIRSWMCRKISSAHPNYGDLMGAWNFDSGAGNTLFDQSANNNDGTLNGAPIWGWSGAAIGDVSAHDYTASQPLALAGTLGDTLMVDNYNSTVSGIHLYRIDETPNYTTPPTGWTALDTSHYWGVFSVDAIGPIDISYRYGNYSYVNTNGECNVWLAGRLTNAGPTWNGSNASRDMVANSLDLTIAGSQVFIIGVDAIPYETVSNGPTDICDGNTVQLSTASSGALSYQWYQNGNPIPSATMFAYTNGTSGDYYVQVTDGGCIYNSDTTSVNIFALPTVTFPGPQGICINQDTVPLVSGMPAGGVYAGQAVNGSSFVPLQVGLGMHDVTYTVTDSNGCMGADTATVEVFPAPLVVFNMPADQCTNDPADSLTIALPNGGVYTGPGISGSNIFDPSAAGASMHSLQYVFTDGNGCADSATSMITVHQAPATPTVSQGGNTLFSSAATGNQWYDANGPIAGATGNTFTPPTSGDYYVIVSDSNGCVSDTAMSFMFVNIDAGISHSIRIFPNPNNGEFQVSVPANAGEAVQIQVMDIQGRVLRSNVMTHISNGYWEEVVQMETVPAGVYLLRLRGENWQSTHKIQIR
ncbi:MAG: LamG-like jellyroll fold domain-containing protein, partial [Bacteroidota bacterium]